MDKLTFKAVLVDLRGARQFRWSFRGYAAEISSIYVPSRLSFHPCNDWRPIIGALEIHHAVSVQQEFGFVLLHPLVVTPYLENCPIVAEFSRPHLCTGHKQHG